MSTNRPSINPAVATLWASAFVLAALVIVQAGRFAGPAAYAEMSSNAGGYTLVTARSGKGERDDPFEILYVLDDRSDTLLVYEIENAQNKRITLRYVQNVAGWFTNLGQ